MGEEKECNVAGRWAIGPGCRPAQEDLSDEPGAVDGDRQPGDRAGGAWARFVNEFFDALRAGVPIS